MIKTVKFVSQRWMEHLEVVRPDTAIISITSPGDSNAMISDGFFSILRLCFDDLEEETIHEQIGAVPDADPDGPVLWHNLRLPDANHAKAIVDFLNRITCERVIVHCHAGVSRSAAVAKFISEKYNADLHGQVEGDYADASGANMRLYRLLNKVDSGEVLVIGKFLPSGEMATVGDQDDFDFNYQWIMNANTSRKT